LVAHGYRRRVRQDGDRPEAKVIGEGDAARVVIGRRTLAFDGEKIVLGESVQ
jgi:hypothetical protein